MNYQLSFGKHGGKTFEWVFFNDPGYAEWMYEKGIPRQERKMDEFEGDYFEELYRRASHLTGICSVCEERMVTRMGMTRHRNSGHLAQIRFYCDDCEYQGGTQTDYYHPSFFVASTMEKRARKMFTEEIQHHYLNHERLTQKRMEEFFRCDANFADGRADFVRLHEEEVQQL